MPSSALTECSVLGAGYHYGYSRWRPDLTTDDVIALGIGLVAPMYWHVDERLREVFVGGIRYGYERRRQREEEWRRLAA